MKLTDDEIVMVLRCAADQISLYETIASIAQSLGYGCDDFVTIILATKRVGMMDRLWEPCRREENRDALLEAAARIEEGYAVRR